MSGEMRNDDKAQDSVIGPPSGGDASRPTKKLCGEKPSEGCSTTRKGKELWQLNLDVLFLVVQYGVEPTDLLNLAYTCKPLRELLMKKTSEFLWKAARRHVKGFPDCPPDLSEPVYAHLAFRAQCQGCGQSTSTVLWRMRRRYCPSCRRRRLCKLSSCKAPLRDVLVSESLTVKNESSKWVESSEMESLSSEYHQYFDKDQFLREKLAQRSAIYTHALHCNAWHKKKIEEHKRDLARCRTQRKNGLTWRLRQLGYNPEFHFFGTQTIQDSFRTFYYSPKLLTEEEWDQIWPMLREIMEGFRLDRLHQTVYNQRRELLADEYEAYIRRQTWRKPTSDLFPHVYDLGHFSPFESIIKAPEGTSVNHQSFIAAFQQLPDLADEWKKKLEAELAEVVKTGLALPSSTTEQSEKVKANLDILDLASSVFFVEDQAGSYAYPDVFLVAMCDRDSPSPTRGKDVQRTGSLHKRFGITFLKEASYIVRLCGLDPGVATAADMDGLNARLRCLSCKTQANSIMNWRAAVWHARKHKRIRSQWQLVSNKHIDAIEAVEQSVKTGLSKYYTRCLLCRPRVGDVFRGESIRRHLLDKHLKGPARRGVHYAHVGIRDSPPKAEMVQGIEVTFRKSTLL